MKLEIYKKIRDNILFLKYKPGEILKENILAKEFGTSRTPIREVLIRLESEKLVNIIPRSGAMVTSIEFPKLRDVYEIRLYTEGLVAKLAAERITDEQIRELKNIKKDCERLIGNGKHEDLINIDLRYREVLHLAAGNIILKEISDYLYNIILRVWPLIFDKIGWDSGIKLTIDEIDNILKAFLKRDANEAEKSRRDFIVLWSNLVAWSLSTAINISNEPPSWNNVRLNEFIGKTRRNPHAS